MSELELLKERADKLGISYHPNISAEKLRERVNAKLEGEEAGDEAELAADEKKAELTKVQKLRMEASKLVRVRITCMNPMKREWQGEIFTCGNTKIGTYRRYVPFNAENGWHVEQIILDMIKERKCQVFYDEPGPRGTKIRRGKLIPEFAVEVLPPLTQKEIEDLAKAQAARNSIG